MYDKKKMLMLKLKAAALSSLYLKNKDLSALSPTELANEFLKVEEEIGKTLVTQYALKEWKNKECHGEGCEGKDWHGKEWEGKECQSKKMEEKE
jgi:hypothetical protein